jgi:hypothetical protein
VDVPGDTVRRIAIGIVTVSLFMAVPARADRREIYALVGYGAGVGWYGLPANGEGSATTYAGAIDLTAYYGLTNTVHVGGRLRLTASSDVRFAGEAVTLSDGTPVSGDVFVDHRALSAGALLLYRFDTGYGLAPLLELGAGASVHEYRNLAVIAAGRAVGTLLPSRSEAAFYASGSALLEYRFLDHWVAAVGIGMQGEPGGLASWVAFVPLRLGHVW